MAIFGMRYFQVNYIDEATQENKTKLFMYNSQTIFDRYCVREGIVIRNQKEVSAATWVMTPKKEKVFVYK
jgi:hypothetical protein